MEFGLFGTIAWAGTMMGLPAIVGTYWGGASLYVFRDGEWRTWSKHSNVGDATPRKCSCGAWLPIEQEKGGDK